MHPLGFSIVCAVAVALGAAGVGGAGFVNGASAQAAAATKAQVAALTAYDEALRSFRAVLAERRAQIEAKQKLPDRPGQALYLARLQVMSTYRTSPTRCRHVLADPTSSTCHRPI